MRQWTSVRQTREVYPWNAEFATTLPYESPFAPREALARTDARTLARELLAMTQAECSAAFRGSPMKRAKLRGLKRNAAVVLGNVGIAEDIDVLARALDDPEPLPSSSSGQAVREHVAWALARLRSAVRPDDEDVSDARVVRRFLAR